MDESPPPLETAPFLRSIVAAEQQKLGLFKLGVGLAEAMVRENNLPSVEYAIDSRRGFYGYYQYRYKLLAVNVAECKLPSSRGSSFPGWRVDTTPYGVTAHELGHHWHFTHDDMRGISKDWKSYVKGEEHLTGYSRKNVQEDIAESFRLFCTNPELLEMLCPLRFEFLICVLTPVETRPWDVILSPRFVRSAQRIVKMRK